MNLIKKIFSAFIVLLTMHQVSFAALSPDCEKYTDCDMRVACELVIQAEKALLGLGADYEGGVADAASSLKECSNYPDAFKKDIDVTLSDNPKVQMVIKWENVRNRMNKGDQGNFEADDSQVVNLIVDILGPDTEAQKKFFEALATAYVNANKADETARLNDAFVLDFLGTSKNFDTYKSAVRDLTGTVKEDDFGIDINWDDVLEEISNVLDQSMQKRGIIVCENDRSYQAAIDAIGWILTAVAAIATFYTGGAGGAAVATGRAALGAGLKAAAKGIAKVGGKAAAKKIAKAGSKQLAKSAVKLGVKANMRGWVNYAGKGVLKTGVKNFVKIVKQNLKNKWTKLAAAGAVVWMIGGKTANKGSTLYALVSSDLDKDYVNCRDLDNNEGCYTICGKGGTANDLLNTKAIKPVLGKNVCVNEKDYMLYEMNSDGSQGKVLVYDGTKHDKLIQALKSNVQDQATVSVGLDFWNATAWGCDYNEDDVDMYYGIFIHDPDTFEISTEGFVIDGTLRLDD